jgi:hypothetical protein
MADRTLTPADAALLPHIRDGLKRSMVIKVAEDMLGRNRLAMVIVHGVEIEVEVLEWDWTGDPDDLVPAGDEAHVYEDGRVETRLLVRLTIGNCVWSAYARRGQWNTVEATSPCSWPRWK